MKLDVAAMNALNIESIPGGDDTMSLHGILNKCRTTQGQRLLSQWIKQPLVDLKRIGKWLYYYYSILLYIVERQDVVEVFVDNVALCQAIQDVFKILPDFFRLVKKFQQGKGTLQVNKLMLLLLTAAGLGLL